MPLAARVSWPYRPLTTAALAPTLALLAVALLLTAVTARVSWLASLSLPSRLPLALLPALALPMPPASTAMPLSAPATGATLLGISEFSALSTRSDDEPTFFSPALWSFQARLSNQPWSTTSTKAWLSATLPSPSWLPSACAAPSVVKSLSVQK